MSYKLPPGVSAFSRSIVESVRGSQSAPSYTPGPYKVERRSEHLLAVLGHNEDHGKDGVVYSGEWLTVCTTDGQEEADRIALCLASHDELLAALKAAESWGLKDRTTLSGHESKKALVHNIRAAIAKAEGR